MIADVAHLLPMVGSFNAEWADKIIESSYGDMRIYLTDKETLFYLLQPLNLEKASLKVQPQYPLFSFVTLRLLLFFILFIFILILLPVDCLYKPS